MNRALKMVHLVTKKTCRILQCGRLVVLICSILCGLYLIVEQNNFFFKFSLLLFVAIVVALLTLPSI